MGNDISEEYTDSIIKVEMKMEPKYSSYALVSNYYTTQCYEPDDNIRTLNIIYDFRLKHFSVLWVIR
jgi:hypothetical protein